MISICLEIPSDLFAVGSVVPRPPAHNRCACSVTSQKRRAQEVVFSVQFSHYSVSARFGYTAVRVSSLLLFNVEFDNMAYYNLFFHQSVDIYIVSFF